MEVNLEMYPVYRQMTLDGLAETDKIFNDESLTEGEKKLALTAALFG